MNNKLTTSFTAGALALAVMGTALPVSSVYAQTTTQTQAQLQAQITALLAQIQQLQAQVAVQYGTASSITLTRNLSLGMTGSDVKALQQFLNSDPATAVALSGVGSKGNETTYFGPATQAAVIKFQNKYKSEVLTPAGLAYGNGYVGPMTRAKINALGTPTVTTPVVTTPTTPTTPTTETPTTPVVVGTEGDITVTRSGEHVSTLELTGNYDEIYGFQVKADDSDMTINRIDFMFDKEPWKYIDTFVLYHNGDKVATIKASKDTLSEVNDEYRLRFNSLEVVVKDGDKDTFVLEAKALKSLSTSRQADDLTVYVPEKGIRAIDTQKLTSQEPTTSLVARTFDFRDAEGDGSIVVTRHRNSPDSGLIEVSATKNMSDIVLVLDAKVKSSDITLQKLYVKVDSSVSDVTKVVRRLSVVHDGDVIATESVIKNGTTAITGRDEDGNTYTIIEANEYYVYFDDLGDIEIDEGDRTEVTLRAEFNKANGSNYSNGTTVNFIARHMTGENSNGEDIINGDLTVGSNETFTLTSDGVTSAVTENSAKVSGKDNQHGIYTLALTVTPFGDDIYLARSTERQLGTTTAGTAGVEYSLENGALSLYAHGSATGVINVKGAKEVGSYFKLNEGETYTITLDVTLDNRSATADSYRMQLETLRYRIGATDGNEAEVTTGFTSYKTKHIYVQS